MKRDHGYDFIRFIATLMILFWHFYTTCSELHVHFPKLLSKLLCYGAMDFGRIGVALFFCLSGSLLIRNYGNNDFQVNSYFTKRFSRIMIPHCIGFITAFLVTYIYEPSVLGYDIKGILVSLLGLNYGEFWIQFGINAPWLIGEWFTAVIIILYVLFPLLRFLFLKFRKITTIIIIIIFAVNLKIRFLSYSVDGVFSISNGLMYFWIGMLFEKYKKIISRKIIVLFSLLIIILVIINPIQIFHIGYLPAFFLSILLFPVMYQFQFSNSFVKYICKYNYEIYLIHHRIFLILMTFMLNTNSNLYQVFLAFVLFTGLIFLLSESLSKITEKLLMHLQLVR